MAKAKPIIIKSGNKVRGPGYDQKVIPEANPSPFPKKVYDPKKSGSFGVNSR